MIYPKYSQLSDMFSKYPVCGVNYKKWDGMRRECPKNQRHTTHLRCPIHSKLFYLSSQGYYTGNAATATLRLGVAQPTIQTNLS